MIAVVHIHKTAGTTLAGVLKRALGTQFCHVYAEDPDAPYFSAADLGRLQKKFFPRLRAILGHHVRVYSDLEEAAGPIEWVTFLRDPITRTASHYQYDVQRGGVDLPFEEWITHPAVADRQTEILAGPDATADEAIALLGRFSFVGLTERFDESLVMLQRAVGLPDVRYAPRWVAPSNEIKRRLLSDTASVRLIEEVNRKDIEVYRWAEQELFPKQQMLYGPTLDDDILAFKRSNERMTRWHQYLHPRYAAYVAKWRLRYFPWVERQRARAETAGPDG